MNNTSKQKRDYRITIRLSEKYMIYIQSKQMEYNKKNSIKNTSFADIIESLIDTIDKISIN
jgi:hypothetical protein